MKKKLAILLAAIMVMAVPAQVLAAVSIARSPYQITNNTAAFENGLLAFYGKDLNRYVNATPLSYAIDGQNLVVTLDKNSQVYAGASFEIVLSGANWYFRNVGEHDLIVPAANEYLKLDHNATAPGAPAYVTSPAAVIPANYQMKSAPVNDADYNGLNYAPSTYDRSKGTFVPQANWGTVGLGSYYRYQDPDLVTKTNSATLLSDYALIATNASQAAAVLVTDGSNVQQWVYADNFFGRLLYDYDVSQSTAITDVTMADGSVRATKAAWIVGTTDLAAIKTEVDTAIGVVYTTAEATVNVPYRMDIGESSNGAQVAKVTVLPIRDGLGRIVKNSYAMPNETKTTFTLTIPLVFKATGNEVSIAIPSNRSFGINVSLAVTPIGTPESARGVSMFALDPNVAGRDQIALDRVIIKENVGGIVETGGIIELTAPAGYKFNNAANSLRDIKVGLEYDLHWRTPNIGGGALRTMIAGVNSRANTAANTAFDYVVVNKLTNYSTTPDYTTVYIYIPDNYIQKSDINTPGRIWIEGLVLVADYAAAFGDVSIGIRTVAKPGDAAADNSTLNLVNSFAGSHMDIGGTFNLNSFPRTNLGIGTSVTNIKVGVRRDWTVEFKATADPVPELVAGRYSPTLNADGLNIDISQTNAGVEHKASPVKLTELAVNAWWAARETTFDLPEGVKFRKIVFDAKSNINTPDNGTVLIANSDRKATHCLDTNRFSLYNLTITADKLASITFTPWVSIAADYPSDKIDLVFNNETASTVSNTGSIAATIATVVKPITVVVDEIIDLQIGYQTLKTGNITIEETKAGMLQRGKEVKVSVTDLITQDLYFAPIDGAKQVTVTKADGDPFALREIKNLDVNNNQIANSNMLLGINSGTISMVIDRESVKGPAKIVLSDLFVKVSRDVPQSTIDYNIVVWGNAVAANYGVARDMFNSPGVIEKYVSVTTSALDIAVLTNEVRITIGQDYILRDGKPQDLDKSGLAYISADGATMVPLRFVSYAFGIAPEQILWDDSTKTATIIHPSRIIQFTAGSDRMILNGAPVTMDYSHIGAGYYKAEIANDRMFIPFRPLGDAFGVTVDWENETQTAIYNKMQ